MIETIYIDECGFTGEDLLNKDQPYFVLASLHLDEQSAKVLKNRFFAEVQANELKFKKLKKTQSRRKMMLKFIEYLMLHPEVFKISVTNKRYALTCKMVDVLVETAMYKTGENAYKDGFNIALSNVLWYTVPINYSDEFFHKLLARFQTLAQKQSVESFDSFSNSCPNSNH